MGAALGWHVKERPEAWTPPFPPLILGAPKGTAFRVPLDWPLPVFPHICVQDHPLTTTSFPDPLYIQKLEGLNQKLPPGRIT